MLNCKIKPEEYNVNRIICNNHLFKVWDLIRNLFILLLICNQVFAEYRNDILVVRQPGDDFDQVVKGINDELNDGFSITEFVISQQTELKDLTKVINKNTPDLLVLMDNKSINLYKMYLDTEKPENPLPSISLMGVLIKNAIKDLKNASGITYEIPVVTSIVNLRSILGIKMEYIGVIHRKYMTEFVNDNTRFCKKEGINIINSILPNNSNNYSKFLLKKLNYLIQDKGIEALWVPNDNILLNPDLLNNVWIRTVKKFRIPVVVGVEVLVDPKLNFGTFAVLPDHTSMGIQASEMILRIKNNGWNASSIPVEPPVAVYKIINYKQVKKNFNVKDSQLYQVDKIYK